MNGTLEYVSHKGKLAILETNLQNCLNWFSSSKISEYLKFSNFTSYLNKYNYSCPKIHTYSLCYFYVFINSSTERGLSISSKKYNDKTSFAKIKILPTKLIKNYYQLTIPYFYSCCSTRFCTICFYFARYEYLCIF